MTGTIFELKLAQLKLAVSLGQMTFDEAIQAAVAAARELKMPQEVIDALLGQGGE